MHLIPIFIACLSIIIISCTFTTLKIPCFEHKSSNKTFIWCPHTDVKRAHTNHLRTLSKTLLMHNTHNFWLLAFFALQLPIIFFAKDLHYTFNTNAFIFCLTFNFFCCISGQYKISKPSEIQKELKFIIYKKQENNFPGGHFAW